MPSIKKDDIQRGIEYSIKENLFESLNKLYNSIPNGECNGCGNCCMESVGANFIEFLNIYNYIQKSKDMKYIIMDRILDYYFLEYTKKIPCPFKDEKNRCSIYSVRPLNCRIYGHWIKEDYEKNYERIKKENIDFAKNMNKNYGINISDEVLNYKIKYCEDFKPSKGYMTKEERMNFYDSVVMLDSKLYSRGIINTTFKDRGIVEYFIESIFYENTSKNIKFNISKDLYKSKAVLNRLKKLILG
ncbi:YkgJ family cysteine cluster protein [Tepidibacter formicigenes]|jgi:Fe-S-cluster containining protein|uniref:Fe-S-cluster containining protein n=1 Tax=Tepidibacter formicigenes DSM 15518 TaxID=1123349 RepID=A0A1M6NAH0_9FIRM|nr:YkgJ family cysteine cluster protein [Tepidibacter formicigenes]SHJ92691.1 Fe-S-cluster containining protein [Tepidibacter formicigenes DSM 15518]